MNTNRGKFLNTSSLLLAGTAIFLYGISARSESGNKPINMPRRTLEKDFTISELDLGCMGMNANQCPAKDKRKMANLISEAVDLKIVINNRLSKSSLLEKDTRPATWRQKAFTI